MKVFVDTWGWSAALNKREARHEEVTAFLDDFWDQEGISYTSDYVLDETITLLFRRMIFETAKAGLEKIERAIREGYLHLDCITPERFEKAKRLRLKFQDKPRISFSDLFSHRALPFVS